MEESLLLNHISSLSKPICKSTSILRLQHSISVDSNLDSINKQSAFVPFFKERDGMGKLISQNQEEITEKTIGIKSAIPELIFPKNRLIKKVFCK